MEREELQRFDITVSGRVQGVAFRWHVQQQARRLGLTGWVRNQPDGSVRIVAEGRRPQLEALVEWAQHGPELARVEDCRFETQAGTGRFRDFEIIV